MSVLLPVIALVLAVFDFALRRGEASPRPTATRIAALVLLAAIAAGLAFRFAPTIDQTAVLAGIGGGFLLILLAEVLGGTGAMAMGVVGASALHLLAATSVPAAQLALVAGAGIGAICLGGEAAATAAITAAACAAADYLGAKGSDVPAAAILGSYLGTGAVVGTFLSSNFLTRFKVWHVLIISLVVLLGALIATRPLNDSPLLVTSAIGAVAGLVCALVLPEEEIDGVRIGLSTMIGIGVATISFGLGRGTGMATSLIAMALPLLGSKHPRAVLTLGPLMALVLYRLLREQQPELSRALDIGQHYAMLGIVLGAVLPLLPSDWLERGSLKGSIGAWLWGVLAIGSPALLIVMLGSRGAVGFVVGLGLVGLCQALRRQWSLQPLALAAGLSGATILVMGWLKEATDLTRDEKLRIFAYGGVGILVIGGLLAFLSRPDPKVEAAS